MQRGSGIYAELDRRIDQIDSFINEHGVKVTKKEKINDYSYRYEFSFSLIFLICGIQTSLL